MTADSEEEIAVKFSTEDTRRGRGGTKNLRHCLISGFPSHIP
jgi:hypothetical protein